VFGLGEDEGTAVDGLESVLIQIVDQVLVVSLSVPHEVRGVPIHNILAFPGVLKEVGLNLKVPFLFPTPIDEVILRGLQDWTVPVGPYFFIFAFELGLDKGVAGGKRQT
jgi:hypothetical protein